MLWKMKNKTFHLKSINKIKSKIFCAGKLINLIKNGPFEGRHKEIFSSGGDQNSSKLTSTQKN